jgi:cellulose synthase/poly-beta-1,6-N-acetylglucosamine synthase-like glycosyltransferase
MKKIEPLAIFSTDELPTVAIHIPIFNEKHVILSTLNSLSKINYPTDKLIIMLLDDSNDETSQIIDEFLKNSTSAKKFQVIRRLSRSGFKAGALAEATLSTTAQFIALFDADCKVPSNFLLDSIHYFKDNESLAAIQTRWKHMNSKFSLFTRAMSIGLDGHFFIEKPGRMSTNGFIAFNGTGGIWRTQAILNAGNWSSKTLAEDLDLAYRTQLMGNSILYLNHISVYQEIAPSIKLWGIQQTRWSRGFAQNLRLYLRKTLFGSHSKSRFQGTIQLTAYLIPFFLLINIISSSFLLFFDDYSSIAFLLSILNLSLAVVSVSGFIVYSIAIFRAKRPWWEIVLIPFFLFWGLSLLIRIFFGVLQGFISYGGNFIRTPKFDLQDSKGKQFISKSKMPFDSLLFIEIIFLLFMGLSIINTIELGSQFIFTSLFYFYIFLSVFTMIFSNLTHAIISK